MKFPSQLCVPVDPSACSYLVAGHLMLRRKDDLRITGVCLNPGRIGFFQSLLDAGFAVRYEEVRMVQGEPVGTIVVPESQGMGNRLEIGGHARIQSFIDEVPLLAAVATTLPGTSVIRNGSELVFKETNRLETTARMLGAFGAHVAVEGDALFVEGGTPLRGIEVPSFGDHRIAMSAVTIAATASAPARIKDGVCFVESFPAFDAAMRSIGYRVWAD